MTELLMELISDKPTYPAQSFPDFTVTFRNVSSTAQELCAYLLEYRILYSMVVIPQRGEELEMRPFKPIAWPAFTAESIVTLASGQEWKLALPLLARMTSWGFLMRHNLPPVIPRSYCLTGFKDGLYEFKIKLTDPITIYVGTEDVFDHRLERRTLSQLPEAAGCLRESLQARASVSFGSSPP